jgi:hypothetical protein
VTVFAGRQKQMFRMVGESQDNTGFTCWGLTPHKFTSTLSVHHKKTGSRKDLAARFKSIEAINNLLGRVGHYIGHNTAILLPAFFCLVRCDRLRFTESPGGNP